jgi:DNA-directed RNA polymerase, mitochondrial
MRDIQLERERMQLDGATNKDILLSMEANKSGGFLDGMISKILNSEHIKNHHDKAVRKRHAFFKITKELEMEEVAFCGLSILLSSIASAASLTVVDLATRIGDDLLVRSGSPEKVSSSDEATIRLKVSAGVSLLDLTLNALPSSWFHVALRRVSKVESVWEVTSTDRFNKIVEENTDVFPLFKREFKPMVCRPDEWEGVTGGGYLSEVAKKIVPLMKRNAQHECPSQLVLDAINQIQQTPYRVNKRIYDVMVQLRELRPAAMGDVFREVKGEFSAPCPIDKVADAYIWEKVEGHRINPKTGKTQKAMVLSHNDDISVSKRKAFFEWTNERDLHKKHELGRVGISKTFDDCLQLADELLMYENLYWPITNDSRSRMYPAAMSGINIHGSDFQKAVVEFSEGLPLDHDGDGEGAVYAIMKTLCNHWGKDSGNGVKTDKLTKKAAQEWIQEASEWIIKCARDPFGEDSQQWMSADSPLLFLAAAMEWADWLDYYEKHKDYGFISRLSDPNDASCSGAQILSAMTRDEIGAMHTNLMDLNVQDLYMAVAAKVTENLLTIFESETLAQDWLGRSGFIEAIRQILLGEGHEILSDETQQLIIDLSEKGVQTDDIFLSIYKDLNEVERSRMSYIIRDLVKKPVMVKFYSGTRYGNIEHVSEFISKHKWADHFRCDSTGKAAVFMGNLIYDSINQVVKGAGQVMEWFIHAADVFGNSGKGIRHVTPAGYPISLKKYKTKEIRLKELFQDNVCKFTIHVLDLLEDENGKLKPQIDVAKFKSSIAPDIVHSFDSSLLMLVSERCKREGINNLWMIHDSLGAHCCYSTRFSRIIRESFVEMFSEDVLQEMYTSFCEQLGDDSYLLQSPEQFGIKYGKYDLNEILKSEFAFK